MPKETPPPVKGAPPAGQGAPPVAKAPYKTSSMDEYVNWVNQNSASNFGNYFYPEAQKEALAKRNLDFRTNNSEFAANREWWGDAYEHVIPTTHKKLGDTILKVASDTGVSPKLLMGNAMEEGFYNSLLSENVSSKDQKPDKDYRYNGQVLLGLDQFGSNVNKLKKYLPKDFDYKISEGTNNKGKTKTALFKTPDDALTAMTAFIKMNKEEVGQFAKTSGTKLTPEAQDFFSMAAYNGGSENMQKMMSYYNKKGLLEGNKFLQQDDLVDDKYGEIYRNVRRRIDPVNGLEKEGHLDFSPERTNLAKGATKSWTAGITGVSTKVGNYQVIQPEKTPFDIIMDGNVRRVAPRGADISKIDVANLPKLDIYNYENNLTSLNIAKQ